MLIEGAISVKSAILNGRRQIECVYIDEAKHTKDFTYIYYRATERDIKVEYVKREFIDELANGKSHGGIIAKCSERTYQTINDLAEDTIFVIDGIEDPFNLGYAMRSLKAFNYQSIVLPKRDYSNMEATILKSSAGAFDGLDVVLAEDLASDLKTLKEEYTIMALNRSDQASDVFDTDYPKKRIIIIGGEKRGINKKVMELVDQEIFFDYPSDFRNALNATSALSMMIAVLEMRGRKCI